MPDSIARGSGGVPREDTASGMPRGVRGVAPPGGKLDSIVVVGGGAAGLAAVEALRAEGYGGPLTLVCGEPHLPYDRPPLSKQVLTGTWNADRTRFREADHYAGKDIRVVHATASSLSLAERAV